MREKIVERLKQIESEFNINILYACESGSRAWGIESRDSDFDVRFIYVHKPDWYISLDVKRDTIEIMDGDLDFSGFELRKALNLFLKSNPSVIEWLLSDIVYSENSDFTQHLYDDLDNTNKKSLMYHYYGLLHRQYKAYWNNEKVPYKKYFYAIRPILAIEFILAGNCLADVNFMELLEKTRGLIPEAVHSNIIALLEIKRNSIECDASRFPILDEFIEDKLANIKERIEAHENSSELDFDFYNELFLNTVKT